MTEPRQTVEHCDRHGRDASLIPNGEVWCATGVERGERCEIRVVFLVPIDEAHVLHFDPALIGLPAHRWPNAQYLIWRVES